MFQFPTKKRRRSARQERSSKKPVMQMPEDEEKLPAIIQGKRVASKQEARVAVALEIIGWRYIYQKGFFGGRSTPGGIVVDFLVKTPVVSTPLLVQSRYWHIIIDRKDTDLYQLAKIRGLPNLADPVELWDYELQSIDQAIRMVRHKIGSP